MAHHLCGKTGHFIQNRCTKADKIEDCNKIEKGKCYNFDIKTRWDDAPIINGVKLEPVNYLILGECFDYDENTKICIEPKKEIYKLYHTKDLKGLCLKVNSSDGK